MAANPASLPVQSPEVIRRRVVTSPLKITKIERTPIGVGTSRRSGFQKADSIYAADGLDWKLSENPLVATMEVQ